MTAGRNPPALPAAAGMTPAGEPVPGNVREGALDHLPARQDLEGVQVIGPFAIFTVSFGLNCPQPR